MADKKHYELIKEGPTQWNEWRHKNPGVNPDLSCSDLQDYDLTDVNFSKTDLKEANLFGVNLTRAKLKNADLRSVNIYEAILDYSDLSGADFTKADGITAEQLQKALTDDDTKLPEYLRFEQKQGWLGRVLRFLGK